MKTLLWGILGFFYYGIIYNLIAPFILVKIVYQDNDLWSRQWNTIALVLFLTFVACPFIITFKGTIGTGKCHKIKYAL
jgi:hypothetical protein